MTTLYAILMIDRASYQQLAKRGLKIADRSFNLYSSITHIQTPKVAAVALCRALNRKETDKIYYPQKIKLTR